MRNRDSTALFLFDMLAFSRDAIALSRGRTRADLDSDLALRLALTHLILHFPDESRISWSSLTFPHIITVS